MISIDILVLGDKNSLVVLKYSRLLLDRTKKKTKFLSQFFRDVTRSVSYKIFSTRMIKIKKIETLGIATTIT